jgi:DNA-binding XRE family transcriptional regulator
MDYAREFLLYRAKHNISQGALGNLLEISAGSVYRIENNIFKPSPLTRTKFDLLKEEENKNE